MDALYLCCGHFEIEIRVSTATASVGREKISQTGGRTRDSLNLVRVRYRYATQPVSGGIINSNSVMAVYRVDNDGILGSDMIAI
jgi:hypothetical protein